MLELKQIDAAGEDDPTITYVPFHWMRAIQNGMDIPEERHLDFYIYNDYWFSKESSIVASASVGTPCLNVNLKLVPLDSNADFLLEQGLIQVRHDTLVAPDLEVFSYGNVQKNSDLYFWRVISSSDLILLGDLPPGHPETEDAACRISFKVKNHGIEDYCGRCTFAVVVHSAIISGLIFDSFPVCDVTVADTVICDGGRIMDADEVNMTANLVIDVFLLSKDSQQVYESAGLQF